jgi:signal transduction histidine kinase
MDAPAKTPPTEADLLAEVARLREQLIQADRLSSVGTLSASIAHEFNNILTTVINYAKMGLKTEDPATHTKAFERILAAGQRAARITSGMLGYVRGRGNRKEPMLLRQLVADVLVLVEKDLQSHRVKLETDLECEAWAEVCPHRLQQAILNLIINARQAMSAGGTLTLALRQSEPAMVEIVVKDTGCGIPADKLSHIFEAFYTTKEVDEKGQGGTGLGLSLCKEVIEEHRGRIRVESAVGRGTTFVLRLPTVKAGTGVKSQESGVKGRALAAAK